MSGIEVVGLITATITIVETINKVFNGLKDAEGLPKAFQEVSGRLPLVQTVLEAVEEQVRADDNGAATQAMAEIVTRCKIRAEDLEKIFKAVMSSEGTSRFEKYRRVIRQLGKEKKVEILAKELLEDVHLLAERHVFQAATQHQVSQLQEAIEELSQVGSSLPDEDGFNLTHYGSGDNIAGNKYTGNNQYHGSGQAFFAPIQNYYQVYTSWSSCGIRMICIKGKPGSGKSTLLRFALYKENRTSASHGAVVLLSFFFHGRGIELQRTLPGFFRSLLYQLLEQAPDTLNDMVTLFQRRCEERGKHGDRWWWHPGELQRFCLASLAKALETRQVTLFLDAINECDKKTVGELITDLSRLAQSAPNSKPFRVCFTCRHYPQILNLNNESTIVLDHENRDDIKRCVLSHFLTDPKGAFITRLIVERARGVFLWARLILNKVQPLLQEGLSVSRIQAEIDRMPEDFTAFYGEIIKTTRYPSATRYLMESVCFSLRPLTTDELRWTLAMDPHRRPGVSLDEYSKSTDFISFDDAEMRIKSLSCGLTESIAQGKSHIVQFIHASVKEFLLEGGLGILGHSKRETPDLVAATAHCRLSLICVCYLQVILTFHPEARDDRNKSKFPLLHYAVTSWAIHARIGQDQKTFTRDLLNLIRRSSGRFIKSWIMLYQRIDPLSRDCPSTGSTLLHIASRYGLTKLLSKLLPIANKTSINARDQDRQTPLLLAAKHGHITAVKLLLYTRNVDIMARDKLGRTSLCRAAQEGHLDVAELLSREEQALVNTGDNYNWTPLSLATDSGHTGVTKLLLGTDGIDIDARDVVQGQTPLSRAARNGHVTVVKLLLNTNNADINAADKSARTPLFKAAEEGHAPVVQVMLQDTSISIEAREDLHHQTPLLCASQNGHVQVIELILDTNKVDVNAQDDAGRSSISLAAEAGHASAVKLLFDTGKARLDTRDKEGHTPLDLAIGNKHETIATLLCGDTDMAAEETKYLN
ncbi:ankyrin repeat-containing protein [Fusarium heterosporum]|uniref:Ankyrin repeat-containing protein n=1 Tax=Fusarium heterosporum TaxID=42747 RepID=A0A8H5TKR2_FUSHE|nr:ankyrin repeat-containing protein [Fusarium heterosporum]